jgi:hypothetical protein
MIEANEELRERERTAAQMTAILGGLEDTRRRTGDPTSLLPRAEDPA